MNQLVNPSASMNTDLYQLTMAAGYYSHQLHEQIASFELYVRRLPPNRNFLIAAGLEQAIDYLRTFQFQAHELEFVKQLDVFKHLSMDFFDYLSDLKFTGDVWALPEGTVFFPYEPIMRIQAPLIQAQLVETWLLSMLNYQTSVASKAARIRVVLNQSHQQADFLDFGSRRAHGPEASVLAARAAYIGGAIGTSNVLAAQVFGLPVYGTAAHAWTMAFDTEPEAFKAYREVFPEHSSLLVDTYDTLQGVKHAIQSGPDLKAIRLDSGDFLSLSKQSRELLDQAGMHKTQIVVSGDMNEYKIQDLIAQNAPIDHFGIGTELVTSIDAPSLGGVYKLVEIQHPDGPHYCTKLSGSKISYPAQKQVWRSYDSAGKIQQDQISKAEENIDGEALMVHVIKSGQMILPPENLKHIQARTLSSLQSLPEHLLNLNSLEKPFQALISPALQDLYLNLKNKNTQEPLHV